MLIKTHQWVKSLCDLENLSLCHCVPWVVWSLPGPSCPSTLYESNRKWLGGRLILHPEQNQVTRAEARWRPGFILVTRSCEPYKGRVRRRPHGADATEVSPPHSQQPTGDLFLLPECYWLFFCFFIISLSFVFNSSALCDFIHWNIKVSFFSLKKKCIFCWLFLDLNPIVDTNTSSPAGWKPSRSAWEWSSLWPWSSFSPPCGPWLPQVNNTRETTTVSRVIVFKTFDSN